MISPACSASLRAEQALQAQGDGRLGGTADAGPLQPLQRRARAAALLDEIGGFDLQEIVEIVLRQLNESVGVVVAQRDLCLVGVLEKRLRPVSDAEHVDQ